ncbi:MAG: HD domain-containing protein [Gammaproteobacteria bacterium]|nr:HD domain-containing protein [Gammaproteobacteria bacterium]
MDKEKIILQTKNFIQDHLKNERSGHDWQHIYRVWQTGKYIAELESADLFIVELTALLHDIADWKLHDGDINAGPAAARIWLTGLDVDKRIIDQVCDIILNMSYKGSGVKSNLTTLEGFIVQDADRLDAIGAIGIARAFTFGGAFGQLIYDPKISIVEHNTFEEYKNKKTTTINHFYEKLLLLKDRMNTETGKNIALKRHQFMEQFLLNFYNDWESTFSCELSKSAV